MEKSRMVPGIHVYMGRCHRCVYLARLLFHGLDIYRGVGRFAGLANNIHGQFYCLLIFYMGINLPALADFGVPPLVPGHLVAVFWGLDLGFLLVYSELNIMRKSAGEGI